MVVSELRRVYSTRQAPYGIAEQRHQRSGREDRRVFLPVMHHLSYGGCVGGRDVTIVDDLVLEELTSKERRCDGILLRLVCESPPSA